MKFARCFNHKLVLGLSNLALTVCDPSCHIYMPDIHWILLSNTTGIIAWICCAYFRQYGLLHFPYVHGRLDYVMWYVLLFLSIFTFFFPSVMEMQLCGITLLFAGFALFTDSNRILLSRLVGAGSETLLSLAQPFFYYIALGLAFAGLIAVLASFVGWWAACLNSYCVLSFVCPTVLKNIFIEFRKTYMRLVQCVHV